MKNPFTRYNFKVFKLRLQLRRLRTHKAKLTIQERLKKVKERAKNFAFRKPKKTQEEIEAEQQLQIENKKKKEEEEFQYQMQEFEEDDYKECVNYRRDFDEEGPLFKKYPLYGQKFAMLYNEDPSQLFRIHDKQQIPNSGIIRITQDEDLITPILDGSIFKEYENKVLENNITIIQSLKKFYYRMKRHPVDIEDGVYEKYDEEQRQKQLEKEQQEKEKADQAIKDLKQNLQQNIDKNVVIQQSKKAVAKLKGKMNNEVFDYMQKNFPDFDTDIFIEEIEYIFIEIYNAYLNHDLNSIKDTCISEAYGYFQGQIEQETTLNAVHKHRAIFNVQQMHKIKNNIQKVMNKKENQWIF